MLRYILKRILLMIPILLGVSFLIFSLMNLTPGDPASVLLGDTATPEQIEALNKEFGYDGPFLQRYFNYIKDIVTKFDFGKSYSTRKPVVKEVLDRAPTSFILATITLFFASSIGVPLGVLSAVKQYSLLDTIPKTLALCIAAMPSFWVGMILMYTFCLNWKLFPSGGIQNWKSFILPMIGLGLPVAAALLRYTRSSMLETIRQDYIRTAKAKGAAPRSIIWKHAMKNALLPVITIMGIDFVALLGNSITTETLFSIPGIGSLLITSIRSKNVPMVMGCSLFIAAFSSIVMLVVDLLYAYIDPRIKAKYSRKGLRK